MTGDSLQFNLIQLYIYTQNTGFIEQGAFFNFMNRPT